MRATKPKTKEHPPRNIPIRYLLNWSIIFVCSGVASFKSITPYLWIPSILSARLLIEFIIWWWFASNVLLNFNILFIRISTKISSEFTLSSRLITNHFIFYTLPQVQKQPTKRNHLLQMWPKYFVLKISLWLHLEQ